MKALWWKHGFIYVCVFREVLIQTHMGPNIDRGTPTLTHLHRQARKHIFSCSSSFNPFATVIVITDGQRGVLASH